MDFPLIPKVDALRMLDEVEYANEARGEFLAEQGSSYCFGGMTPGDASYMASFDLAQQEQEWAMSEEGQRFEARLPAARLYEDVQAALLSEDSIAEFVDGKVSYEHSLFGAPRHRIPSSDDIPF